MYPHQLSAPIGRRYFVWIFTGFLLGILCALHSSSATENLLRFLLFGLGLLAGIPVLFFLLNILFKRLPLSFPDFLLLWFVLLSFFLGVFRVYCYDHLQYQTLRSSVGHTRQYIGVLTEEPAPSNSEKTLVFPVKLLYLEQTGVREPCHGKLLLYTPPELTRNLTAGDIISFSANLTEPEDASYSGGFSMRNYLHQQGYLYFAQSTALFRIGISYEPDILDRISLFGKSIQDSILQSIDQSFGSSSEESALLKGVLLGVQDDFTPEQYSAFVDSGLIHITSVSGMHVVFLSRFFLFLLSFLCIPRRFTYCLLIPVLFLFCAVAAFTPSVCRSTIMMVLFFLAQILQRDPDSLTSLSVSAAVLLLINPYSVTSYSFLLSYSSTLGILLFASSIQFLLLRPFLPRKDKLGKTPSKLFLLVRQYFVDPVTTSLSMTAGCLLGMGYFGMRFFRRITWGSFPANLCLLPLASVSFILGLINWPLFYLCPALSRLLAKGPLHLILWCINRIADVFSHPFFRIVTPTPPASFWLPYLVFCIAIYFSLKPLKKNT